MADALGQAPTLDFALAVLARGLHLPAGAGLMLFALGRTVGWIGHALEAYEADVLIRPRARYAGPAPTMETGGSLSGGAVHVMGSRNASHAMAHRGPAANTPQQQGADATTE